MAFFRTKCKIMDLYPKVRCFPLKFGIYIIGTKENFKVLSQYIFPPLNLTGEYEAVDVLLLYIFFVMLAKSLDQWHKKFI